MQHLVQLSTLVWCSVLTALVLICSVSAEDFYKLLDVTKQASAKEIRKAFKKLALKTHPDKNQDDAEAHEKFLKINRAYEVLKDEEMRKKYDLYGEDGLKESGPSGRGYKSWSFYNSDFGIYDDDPEIITLSKSDFEQSVENTQDIWFINFYSPQCSHCHQLAPTWREVARDLEGVIRIGAVNCGDEWMLCRKQGIRSYPSLLMFPQREKYSGERTKRELIKYSMQQVRAPLIELWSGNFESEIQDDERGMLPWVISFCGEGGDCLEHSTGLKVAAMLADLSNVATVDCHERETICDDLGISYGTYYFSAGNVTKGSGLFVDTLDAKELTFVVLSQLPDIPSLDKETFQNLLSGLKEDKGSPWLIHFAEGEVVDLELRKLPGLLDHIQVGYVDCQIMRTQCNDLHIHKFPAFVVFKRGQKHEIYHGRQTSHDIAAFARDSSVTPVEVLGPNDFPDRVVENKDPWFVDFYAPWCPPCMRLLPEFRKASKHMSDKVSFGTVDCTIHSGICSKYSVRSYPTTIFFNQSVPHHYQGHHSMDGMIEFLEDTLKPPVLTLDDSSFTRLVEKGPKGDVWLVDFFAPWCGPCQQLAPEWRRLAKKFNSNEKVNVASVDCVANGNLCTRLNVRSYPSVRLYPAGSSDTFHTYNNWFRDSQAIYSWVFEFLPTLVKSLGGNNFRSEVLGSSDPWIIDFYASWCGPCQTFAPEFEKVAEDMKDYVRAGKVECDRNQHLCNQAGIRSYPTVLYYKGSPTPNNIQSIYGEEIDSQSADFLIKTLKQKVKNKKKIPRDEL